MMAALITTLSGAADEQPLRNVFTKQALVDRGASDPNPNSSEEPSWRPFPRPLSRRGLIRDAVSLCDSMDAALLAVS
jgi:hypothetical protein